MVKLKRDYIVNDPRKGKVTLKKDSIVNPDMYSGLAEQITKGTGMKDKMVRSTGVKRGT